MTVTYLSPEVDFQETDNTLTTPQVGVSVGASVIQSGWGPVLEPQYIDSENTMVNIFGKPADENFKDWLCAANYLSYVSSMWVVRAKTKGMANAVATPKDSTPVVILNDSDYTNNYELGGADCGQFACKYPGALGNSIMVTYADAATFKNWKWTDSNGNEHDWTQEFAYPPATSEYAKERDGANDEIHLLVVDAGGRISGTKGTILEKYSFLSKAKDAKTLDGVTSFYRRVLKEQSNYVYWMDFPTTDELEEEGVGFGKSVVGNTFASLKAPFVAQLKNGADDFEATDADIMVAFDEFKNAESYDLTNIICGSYSATVAKYIVENICEKRRDCVAFISPNKDGAPIVGNLSDEDRQAGITTASAKILTETVKFREQSAFNVNSSYAVMDSAWKYQYDKYNDEYRWVPLCGDTAGLRARTSSNNAPWFSEGGYSRGQYKNVVKLSFNPNKEQRDILYPKGINPAVTFAGEGTILYGDKTLLTKPSAFQHTNVRFLFIYLEKTLVSAAKYLLFEINDDVPRTYARNLVEPFLEEVKGGRGCYDYKVICDESNNTPEVIDDNMFKMMIKVKPARSINAIMLDFTAEKTGASMVNELG